MVGHTNLSVEQLRKNHNRKIVWDEMCIGTCIPSEVKWIRKGAARVWMRICKKCGERRLWPSPCWSPCPLKLDCALLIRERSMPTSRTVLERQMKDRNLKHVELHIGCKLKLDLGSSLRSGLLLRVDTPEQFYLFKTMSEFTFSLAFSTIIVG